VGRLIVAQMDMGDHVRCMGIDVHQRGGHGTSSLQVGFYKRGAQVASVCRSQGDVISGGEGI
jgi:hypothetical protein